MGHTYNSTPPKESRAFIFRAALCGAAMAFAQKLWYCYDFQPKIWQDKRYFDQMHTAPTDKAKDLIA